MYRAQTDEIEVEIEIGALVGDPISILLEHVKAKVERPPR